MNDKETLEKVANAMSELVTYLQNKGQFFTYTCAFKSVNSTKVDNLFTISDYTPSDILSLYEAISCMNLDILTKIEKNKH